MKAQELPLQPRISFWSLIAGSILFIVFMVWLGIYHVEEVTRAPGVLEPVVGNAPIKFPSSGIIVDLPIREGMTVKANDTLLKLDSLGGDETVESLREQIVILEAQRARIGGLLAGRAPDFRAIDPLYREIIANQRQLYNRELSSYQASLAVFDNSRASLDIQMLKAKSELAALDRQIALTQEELDIQATLAKEGIATRTQLITLQKQLETLLASKTELPLTIRQFEEERRGIDLKQQEYTLNLNREYNRELARIDEELRVLRARIDSSAKASRFLAITSPIDGTVSGLKKRRAGEVIAPNELIMEIVPLHPQYMAKVQIPAQNIGYLKAGLEAIVTIDAYQRDPRAQLTGTLADISSSSMLDDKGRPYYQATINLDAASTSANSIDYPLFSGMTLNCQVITGKRSILEYIFHTILRSSNEAFKER